MGYFTYCMFWEHLQTMVQRPASLVLSVVVWLAAYLPAVAVADDAAESLVRNEAPRAWSLFRKRAENMRSIVVEKHKANGVETSRGKFTSQSRGSWKLIVEELFSSDAVATSTEMLVTVYGINDQYYFELRAPTRKGPYKLVKLQRLASDEVGRPAPRDLFIRSWASENDFLTVEVEALPEIFKKPYFQFKSADYITEGNKRYIRCEIGYDAPKREPTIPFGKAWIPFKAFTLDLDPEDHYRIRRVTAELKEKDTPFILTEEISERSAFEGPRYVSQQKSVNKTSGEVMYVRTHEYLERSFDAPPKANFYLTAFGLPEPPGFQKPGVPTFVWLGGAGLILVVAGLFWHRYRKAAK